MPSGVMEVPFWDPPEAIAMDNKDDDPQQRGDGADGVLSNPAADIWAAGITAIEMATGQETLYDGVDPFRALFLMKSDDPVPLPENISKTFKDFLSLCLQKDPALRPTAGELLKHKFLRNSKTKGRKLAEYINFFRDRRTFVALTPRIAINSPSDVVMEDSGEDRWEFKRAERVPLVVSILDTLESDLTSMMASSDQSPDPSSHKELVDSVSHLKSLFKTVVEAGREGSQNAKLEEKLMRLFQSHFDSVLNDEYREFGSRLYNLDGARLAVHDMDVRRYLNLGLFSRFVLSRWRDKYCQPPRSYHTGAT
mmetsp:Transcript_7255/g.18590  ORF Transcript_7255/g.18590 Transcript_7255/m.18590 type:complete len:309 (+) Transcript_7255:734-1660(+)